MKIAVYIALSILFLTGVACKRNSGHAQVGEDAELLQVDDSGKRINNPNPAQSVVETDEPVIEMPPIEEPVEEPLEVEPPAAVIVGEDEAPTQLELPPVNLDPYPSLAAKTFGKSQLSETEYSDGNKRFADVKKRATEKIQSALSNKGLYLGDPIFIRVLKEEKQVELFIQNRQTELYQLAHTYNIAAMSGKLGPKKQEGDGQAPEGFYYVPVRMFNHGSQYHLSFNIGFPNKYDLAHERTGSFIMMHGAKASIGCYAMTDEVIEEIYTICHAALSSGKQRFFRFHSFPFRMTEENMQKHANSEHFEFWKNLKQGYDYFESHQIPPDVSVSNKTYTFK